VHRVHSPLIPRFAEAEWALNAIGAKAGDQLLAGRVDRLTIGMLENGRLLNISSLTLKENHRKLKANFQANEAHTIAH
jgi:hypothetical protein